MPTTYGAPTSQSAPPASPRPPGPQPLAQPPAAAPAGPPVRRRSRGLVVGLVVLLALVLAGGATAVVRPGPVAGWLGDEPAATSSASGEAPEPDPSPVLVAATGAATPTPAGVKAAIDPLVRDSGLGARFSVSVIDAATGQSLYARGPDVATVPASTTKLVTAVTVLAARGPAYRIPTRVLAGARPGEVVLIGGGDPTLAINATASYPTAARLDQLAAQVKRALGGATPTRVSIDSSLFQGSVYGPGWDDDIPTGGFAGPTTALMTNGGRVDPKATAQAERFATPDLAAGQAFARLLGLSPEAVSAVARVTAPPATGGPAPTGTPDTPDKAGAPEESGTPDADPSAGQPSGTPAPVDPGTELGRVESPPVLRLVEIMLAESDNVVAEALARQVALAKDAPATYAGAASAMRTVIGELGLPAAQAALVDGSGLSRLNRLPPSLLTALLAKAATADPPALSGVVSGLPVAGWSGTLVDRFQAASGSGRPGVGVVRAKTGTLSGVDAMAGLVTTTGGRVLAFALLADGVPIGHFDAQAALDAIAAALAKCGCR